MPLASVTAFLISESVDWLVDSTTHRPFAERVWWSVLGSAPVDTAVFLVMAGFWSWSLSPSATVLLPTHEPCAVPEAMSGAGGARRAFSPGSSS